jgi:N-acetylmuramoyl-L-alanine amidase
VNPGPLATIRPGKYSAGGREYLDADVLKADGRVWARYPDAQISAGVALATELRKRYPGIECVGHSEVCDPAGRKLDPGPAFPWDSFR